MAIFSEFMRVYRQMEQGARARGSRLSEADMASLSGVVGEYAGAETEGRIAQETKAQSLKDIAASRGRFSTELGVSRERLELQKRQDEINRQLGYSSLKADEQSRKHARRQMPWALGLGALDIGVSAYERSRQERRDKQYRDLLDRLIKGGSGGTTTNTGRTYTPNPWDRRVI